MAQYTKENGAKGESQSMNSDLTVFWHQLIKFNFICRQQHGHGTLIVSEKEKYQGSWQMGQMHGKGAYVWDNGDSYDGNYKVNDAQRSLFYCTNDFIDSNSGRQEGRNWHTHSCPR